MSQDDVVDSGGLPIVVNSFSLATTVSTNPDTQCEVCGRVLAVDETFTEHLVCVHLTSGGLCDTCGGNPEDFIEHFKMHLKSYQLQAVTLPPMVSIKTELIDKYDLDDNYDTNAGLSVTDKIKVKENLKIEVEENLIIEVEENLKFEVEEDLKIEVETEKRVATKIEVEEGDRKEMKKHVASVHGEHNNSGRAGYCSACKKTVSKLNSHTKRVHLQLKHHFCTLCEKGFYDKRDLERHISDMHELKTEVCTYCGLFVKRLPAHIKKMHSHKPPKELCPECGKSVGDVRDHMKSVHEKVKKFSCPICPLKTYKKGTLNRHMAVHAKYSAMNKPYPLKTRTPEGGKQGVNPKLDQREAQQRLSKKASQRNNPNGGDFIAENSPFVTKYVTGKSDMLGLQGSGKPNADVPGANWNKRNPMQ